jgi:hypothetical protein
MSQKFQNIIIAILILVLLLPLLSLSSIKNKRVESLTARAEGIAKIENVEKMSINAKLDPAKVKTQTLKLETPKNSPIVIGEMIVKFRSLADRDSFAAEKGGRFANINTSKLINLNIGDDMDIKKTYDAIEAIKSDSRVEYAEPNYISHIMGGEIPLNIDYSAKQWHLKADTTQSYHDDEYYGIPARDTLAKVGYDANVEKLGK